MARKDTFTVEDWTDLAKEARYHSEQLALLLNVGPRQLRRYTHELFNNSPEAWLYDRRLADAALLLQSEASIKTIAFKLGFKTVSHFSNKFKARYGVSPKRYKDQRKCPSRATDLRL